MVLQTSYIGRTGFVVEACAVITDGTAQEMGLAGHAAWPRGGRCTSLSQQTGISFQNVCLLVPEVGYQVPFWIRD